MNTSMRTAATIILGAAVSVAAYAATAPVQPVAGADSTIANQRHGHHRVGFGHLLGKLNLSADQKTQIRSILAQARPQMQSLHAISQSTRDLLSTTPPSDPSYAGLVATAKVNAAARIELRSSLWSQVHAVLTPAQQAQLPGLVAARKSEWAARKAAWRAQRAAADDASPVVR